jgi:hypothetical protein
VAGLAPATRLIFLCAFKFGVAGTSPATTPLNMMRRETRSGDQSKTLLTLKGHEAGLSSTRSTLGWPGLIGA